MRLLRVILPGILGLGFSVAVAAADCPNNSWAYGPGLGGSSTLPALNYGAGSYDLVAGTFSASSCCGGEGGSSTQLQLSDTYWLVGPASATPMMMLCTSDRASDASAPDDVARPAER